MDPEGDKHRKIILNKKSVGCQTDQEPVISSMSVETQTLEEAKIINKCVETQTEDMRMMTIDTQTMEIDVPVVKIEEKIIVVDSSSDSDSGFNGTVDKDFIKPAGASEDEVLNLHSSYVKYC